LEWRRSAEPPLRWPGTIGGPSALRHEKTCNTAFSKSKKKLMENSNCHGQLGLRFHLLKEAKSSNIEEGHRHEGLKFCASINVPAALYSSKQQLIVSSLRLSDSVGRPVSIDEPLVIWRHTVERLKEHFSKWNGQ
jgi:hypothetical protein